MPNEVVKFVHAGIEVVYYEREDVWRFTLRGRERVAENPLKAKEAIDKPVASEKAKPFTRIKAIKASKWSNEFVEGEITSIARVLGRERIEVWFVSSKGNRQKTGSSELRSDTEGNRVLMAQALDLYRQAYELKKQAQDKTEQMSRVMIEVPE